jgi:cytochrome c oxidase subunit IV
MHKENNSSQIADIENQHHLVPFSTLLLVWSVLLLLTAITVAASVFFPGNAGITIAFLVTPIKASLVLMFFMHLKYEHKGYAIMFLSTIFFMAIFLILTFTDYLYR